MDESRIEQLEKMSYEHRMTAERAWYCTACGQTKPREGDWCCIVAEYEDLRFSHTIVALPTRLIGIYLHNAWWSLPEPPFIAWRP